MNTEQNQCTGCCHSHPGQCCGHHGAMHIPAFTADAIAFLHLLSQIPFLPVGRFLLKSSRSHHLESVALAPVYLVNPHDSMEVIQTNAKALKELEQYGVISLDYDTPLKNYDYGIFLESVAYRYLQETVEAGRDNPDFIFDIAALELGSIAVTAFGQDALDALEMAPEQRGSRIVDSDRP